MPSHAVRLLAFLLLALPAYAGAPRALPKGERPNDQRLRPLRTLDDYFPFKNVDSPDQWRQRAEELRRQVLVSNGLWPTPTRTPLNAVVHSPVERNDYTVYRVYFESFPGHFVTGSLYRPKPHVTPRGDKLPAVLCPHGHWADGRFHAFNDDEVKQQIAQGGERFVDSGRYPLQARCVQLARMGCLVFHYDMVGYADSVQLDHRPGLRSHMTGKDNWAFFSPQAELRLINMMGLQTWNSVRALDFVLALDEVDEDRIAVTGASGGGTQTFMLTAIDDRIDLSIPCVMVSTAMQGGCTCENAPYLRIDAGNIDLAALAAPRPLGLVSADDWTVELETKGFPDLLHHYEMLGHKDRVSAAFNIHFGHNYNAVSRCFMYGLVNEHFNLGLGTPIIERDFVPLSREELTVWTGKHRPPSGNTAGDAHERDVVRWWANDAAEQVAAARDDAEQYQRIAGGGWRTILGPTLHELGDVTVEPNDVQHADGYRLSTGMIDGNDSGQQLPALFLLPEEGWNDQLVIWLTDRGKAGLLDVSNRPVTPVQNLLDKGYAVVGIDMIGQGEFVQGGERVDKARLHTRGDAPWQHAAAYTFGYNRPLLVQRVHDVLATIRAAQTYQTPPARIHLVGIGREAGPIALAAHVQSGDAISKTAVHTSGFAFDLITRFDDPMFVPGAVRYEGVGGLRTLAGGNVRLEEGKSPDEYEIASMAEWVSQ